ncbi:MAG: bifunctional phosphopantothenoylcysteine decarboxylase/phosphopantothenate--cysteine ligase CoaBC [Provencibacterium sp.]|jgi:phosphopantothenoylcysteine decarboxylase/phosphopantothenate--cysteine ligase|nr:bifunctional phosphopantothenoylcysteine decarboxylase/phosphopantothenate--cysteine ligase CoaBC [Provencibacterium sp.]
MEKKTVALGVTGSIAAYKAAQLCSNLHKKGYDVHVLMTRNATELVAPLTFETLSGNRVSVDTFDRNFEWNVQHVSLAKRAGVFVVAPATANLIAKMACGLCDDMLTTTLLAARCEKIVCPAMNTGMYDNPATQQNLEILRERGVQIVEPGSGLLACGDTGKGRLADLEDIEEAVAAALSDKPLQGLRVTVTAGGTREALDPVRFITNHSSGKMGYALARMARYMGAEVTLISANCALRAPYGVRVIPVVSAAEMCEEVLKSAETADILIKAAAPADYRPAQYAPEKIKKSEGPLLLPLERTADILSAVCARKRPGQVICGFSMETENLIENSTRKLHQKGCDMIVANSLRTEGAGFGTDTNIATLITRGGAEELPLMQKEDLARQILLKLCGMRP